MTDAEKTSKTVTDTLAEQIRRNSRNIMTGALIGAISGIVIATLTGRCKFCIGMWGGLAGGSLGYLCALREKKMNCCI